MDLTINRLHASRGKRKRIMMCHTALALKAEGFIGVRVDGTSVELRRPGERRYEAGCYNLSDRLSNNITKYDEGKPFKTGTYRIAGLKRPTKKS